MGVRRRLLTGVSVGALMVSSGATAFADEERGIDPNQGDRLVEVALPSKAAAIRLQLEAETYGVEFNDHYLRTTPAGVVVTVFGDAAEIEALQDAGYEIGATVESARIWERRLEAREAVVRKEERADAAAIGKPDPTPDPDNPLVVLRADYFENYAGRFLSVEAKYRGTTMSGNTYVGPALSLSWNTGDGTAIDQGPRTMNLNIDPDTNPDSYVEHRELLRVGEVGESSPRPTRIRIGASSGESVEAGVDPWLDGGLPPMADDFVSDFTERYMDPTEVYGRFAELADEYGNIAELVPLPYETNGYQRRAQAIMAGTTLPGNAPSGAAAQNQAVVLTSRAWGHEGGNDVSAEFVNPGVPDAPLAVAVAGKAITVTLATNAAGQPSSTASQVAAAINASEDARQLVVARTYRTSAGTGTVAPRARVNLSDFLRNEITMPDGTTRVTNDHVQRGPYRYSAMRIGKERDGSKVGVFLYCQQHAREWATPLTCLETAEQLLTNYATDERTRRLVDNLDIFILPSSNPDGSHYSIHNFSQQRRNMTNHCVVGGKETDDPSAASFWTPTVNPATGLPIPGATTSDPAGRNQWGVDLNRNNTFGTLFDGYIGASTSCTVDTYTGPSEASEPEIRNELWIADTFDNIKFSNNIHSFGGYFMWAPGTYRSDRSEGDAVHANIGVEKYFFEAGDRILDRIKEVRGTTILPERTGPIADVLYSAAGNSSDEHWYNRGVIAYSFETGADRFGPVAMTVAAPAGATAIRLSNQNRSWFDVGDPIVIGYGTPTAERRTVTGLLDVGGTTPNVQLDAPLQFAHPASALAPVPVWGEITQVPVGFQPPYATEGKFEALEFAAGNYGLLESAYDYAFDKHPPTVRMTNTEPAPGPIRTTFEFLNEPSVIHYTRDGSMPTESSTEWDSSGPREPGQVITIESTTTVRWRAEDIKGNVSYGSQKFTVTKSKG